MLFGQKSVFSLTLLKDEWTASVQMCLCSEYGHRPLPPLFLLKVFSPVRLLCNVCFVYDELLVIQASPCWLYWSSLMPDCRTTYWDERIFVCWRETRWSRLTHSSTLCWISHQTTFHLCLARHALHSTRRISAVPWLFIRRHFAPILVVLLLFA